MRVDRTPVAVSGSPPAHCRGSASHARKRSDCRHPVFSTGSATRPSTETWLTKWGQNPPPADAICMIQACARIFGAVRVRIQLPVEAAGDDRESPLEPEVAVPAANKGGYQRHHPRGYALLLAVEVSDSTAGFDLTRKAAIYANAGVREYWVLDLPHRLLAVHRNPDGPVYRLVQLFSAPDAATMEGVGKHSTSAKSCLSSSPLRAYRVASIALRTR